MADIFLSYSRKDSHLMARVRDDLRAAGFNVWTDENLKPGTPVWVHSIEQEIRDAQSIVVLLSPDAANSVWVTRELTYAQSHDKPIIPVLIRGHERDAVPLIVSTEQHIDARHDYATAVADLIVTLGHLPEIQPRRAPRFRQLSIVLAVIVISVLVALAVDGRLVGGPATAQATATPTLPPTSRPMLLASVEVGGQEDDIIFAYNETGFPIWQVQIGTPIVRAEVDDLDGDGVREAVVGLSKPGDRSGWLQVYSEGGDLLDEFNLWEESIYGFGAGSSDQMTVVDFAVADLEGKGQPRIVAVADDTHWFASKVAILEFSGGQLRQLSRFWNPGLLYSLNVKDLDGDGRQEIVLTGVNNNLQAVVEGLDANVSAVFVLRGEDVSGQGPPEVIGEPGGSQLWYGFAMPPSASVSNIEFVDQNDDGTDEVHVQLNDACSFYVTVAGDIIGRGSGTACKDESSLFIITP